MPSNMRGLHALRREPNRHSPSPMVPMARPLWGGALGSLTWGVPALLIAHAQAGRSGWRVQLRRVGPRPRPEASQPISTVQAHFTCQASAAGAGDDARDAAVDTGHLALLQTSALNAGKERSCSESSDAVIFPMCSFPIYTHIYPLNFSHQQSRKITVIAAFHCITAATRRPGLCRCSRQWRSLGSDRAGGGAVPWHPLHRHGAFSLVGRSLTTVMFAFRS
jgi:hypothetical protein